MTLENIIESCGMSFAQDVDKKSWPTELGDKLSILGSDKPWPVCKCLNERLIIISTRYLSKIQF